MIFDRNYDLALLSIMKTDKKNQESIQKFISEIPPVLMSNIRTSIAQVKNNEFVFDGEASEFFHQTSESEPRVYFYFDINEDGSLRVCKEYYNGQWEDDLFELKLYPIDLDEAKKMNRSSVKRLGRVIIAKESDEVFPDISCLEYFKTEYDLMKAPVGHFVRFNRTKEQEKRRLISMKRVSQEVNRGRLLK